MASRLLLYFIAFTIIFGNQLALKADDSYPHPPVRVSLFGTLEKRIFPGPPNYTSVRQGDQPRNLWVVQLRRPATFKLDKKETIRVGSIVQLIVIDKPDYSTFAHLKGKSVEVKGEIFAYENAMHHTPFVMIIKSISSKFQKSKPKK